MKILDCKQGSTEWAQCRLGVVTASEADALISPLGKPRTGEGVETYLYRKLAEKTLGVPVDSGGGSWGMDQGQIVETIARPWYSFSRDVEVSTPGFCVSEDGRIGCSPDGVVGDSLGLEIKSPQPPTHLKYLLNGGVPPEYRAQVQFSLYVTQFPEWEFVSYSRQFSPLVIRVLPDPAFQWAIKVALLAFFSRFDAALAKVLPLTNQPATGTRD